MKQELRFGLDLGRLAILRKKIGSIMSNFLGWFFHVFKVHKCSCEKRVTGSSAAEGDY